MPSRFLSYALFALVILTGCGGPNGSTHVVTENTIAATSLENLALAIRAGRNGDTAAELAVLADGRAYEIEAGTRVYTDDSPNDGVAVVVVESGSLVGKTLYMNYRNLKRTETASS
jgi:hypothetical protein